MNEAILQYLRENRDRYTREVLRKALISAGYDPIEIDEAWASLEAGPAGDSARLSRPGPAPDTLPLEKPTYTARFWLTFVVYLAVIYGVAWGLLALGSEAFAAWFAIALLAGSLGWSLRREEDRPLAAGLGCGVVAALLIPFVLVVIVFGLCVAGVIRPF